VYGFTCKCPRCITEVTHGWDEDQEEGSSSSGEWETDSGEEDMSQDHDAEHMVEDTSYGGVASAAVAAAAEGAGAQGAGGAMGGLSGSVGHSSDVAAAGGGEDGEGQEALDPAYLSLFLLKYVCSKDGCFGTLAAVRGSDVCECNMCGCRRSEAEFLASLDQ
jgi:SET and MYND domain-containing protein